MNQHTIQSDGFRLRVSDRGSGTPLLMVHGMWCEEGAFDSLRRELPTGLRTIALDLRGHGRSGTPRRSWSVKDVAGDLRVVMDTLAVERAVLLGHSLGGMAALQMALAHPERILGLVLIGTSAERESPERKSQLDALALTVRLSGVRKWMVRLAAESFFAETFRRQAPERVAGWCRRVRAMPRKAVLQALDAVKERPSVMERLAEIEVPTLVVCGEHDAIADPANALTMARHLPHGRSVIVPAAGHALPYEQPRELAAVVGRFLTRHGFSAAEEGAAP